MPRVELVKEFPGDLRKAFDYIQDFTRWREWFAGLTDIIEPELGAWTFPGDSVRIQYRLLGRTVEGEAILEGRTDYRYVCYSAYVPGLPKVTHTWRYKPAGEGFTISLTSETDPHTSFFGRTIDALVIPRALERDVRNTLNNLSVALRFGFAD